MVSDTKKFSADIPLFVSRGAALILGLIFLIAGMAKVVDLNEAARQANAYGLVKSPNLLLLLVWGLTLVECALGMALLLYYRVRPALVLTTCLLALFIAVLGWAWMTGVTEDCGCFGQWAPRSPGEAMLEDLVILILVIAAWLGYKPPVAFGRNKIKFLVVALASVASIVLPFVLGFSLSTVLIPGVEGPPIKPLTIVSGETINWDQEVYLVELMATDCGHCQDSVMDVNILADTPGVPPVIALCANTEEDVAIFQDAYLPEYPMLRVDEEHFWRLVATGAYPRFLLVVDGHVIHAWELDPPQAQDVLDRLESSS